MSYIYSVKPEVICHMSLLWLKREHILAHMSCQSLWPDDFQFYREKDGGGGQRGGETTPCHNWPYFQVLGSL